MKSRGTFIEFRKGLINVCPQGRDTTCVLSTISIPINLAHPSHCSTEEQDMFESYDKVFESCMNYRIRQYWSMFRSITYERRWYLHCRKSFQSTDWHALKEDELHSTSFLVHGTRPLRCRNYKERGSRKYITSETRRIRRVYTFHNVVVCRLHSAVWQGGNDHEIFNDARVIGHSVSGPEATLRLIEEIFMISPDWWELCVNY